MGNPCSKPVIEMNDVRYDVLEMIGEGGFSQVFLVRDRSTKKKYAVKRIFITDAYQEDVAEREVAAYELIKDKHVIECLGHCYRDRSPIGSKRSLFIRFPYYPRGTLGSELRRREKIQKRMEPLEVLKIFGGICEGVRKFHECKPVALAHRDIKPDNILLAEDNTPVIMDLGSVGRGFQHVYDVRIARSIQDRIDEMCTLAYRAPELFNITIGEVVCLQADIWSLGCLLFAMCYFKNPFDGVLEKGDSLALAVLSGYIKIPDTYYPVEMNNLILEMMNVDPVKRPCIEDVINKVDYVSKDISKKSKEQSTHPLTLP